LKMAEVIKDIIDQAKSVDRTYLMEHESKAILEELGISTTGSVVQEPKRRQWRYSSLWPVQWP